MSNQPSRSQSSPRSQSSHNWPMLRSIMDQALLAPQGLRLTSLATRPLTVASAAALRNSMGKVRMASRQAAQKFLPQTDPAWGISPYDALTMVVVPLLEEADIHIQHNSLGDIPPEWLSMPLERLPLAARTLATACTITIRTPLGGTLQVTNAPSFVEGWRGIRNELPAALDLINTYQATEGQDFILLGHTNPQPVSPTPLARDWEPAPSKPLGLKTIR